MSQAFDLTDVPAANAQAMNELVQILVSQGRAGALFRGVTRQDRIEVENEFWNNFEGPSHDGVATLLRFWALVDLFRNRRVMALFQNRGFVLTTIAAKAVSQMRLNANWGFNPQRVLWALQSADAMRPAYASTVTIRPEIKKIAGARMTVQVAA